MEIPVVKFYATLECEVALSDESLQLLLDCATRHYSWDCKKLVEPGGTLYGWKNRRQYLPDDKLVILKSRDINILSKVIENENSRAGIELFSKLHSLFKSLQNKTREVNENL